MRLPREQLPAAAAALCGAGALLTGLLGGSDPLPSYPSPSPAPSTSSHSTVPAPPPGFLDRLTRGLPEGASPAWLHLLPQRLLPTAASADASGYDALAALQTPLQDAPYGDVNEDGDDEDDPDTITGVFHRLDEGRARLALVQVVFRHGARTPLTDRRDMWGDAQWDVCGQAYQAAAVRLRSTAGVEDPVSKGDLKQRSVVLPGGCRKGELTLVGQAQARRLGEWLRARYGAGGRHGFLPPEREHDAIAARTTNVSRTIATLRGVLTGLYPSQQQHPLASAAAAAAAPPVGEGSQGPAAVEAREGAGAEEPWQVTTSGDLDEILYADRRACPHLASFTSMSHAAGRVAVRADPTYPAARDALVEHLGFGREDVEKGQWAFTEAHDVLTSLAAHGKPLPGGLAARPDLVLAINRLATKEFSAELAPSLRDSAGRTVLRLSMGRLLHTLIGNMHGVASSEASVAAGAGGVAGRVAAAAAREAKQEEGAGRQGQEARAEGAGPRMYLYSGHDSTVLPLLAALGAEVTEWPPYASNLVLELWELPPPPAPRATPASPASPAPPAPPPRHAVRVLYNGEELPLPHCPPGYLPSLPTFAREVVGPFALSPAQYSAACRVRVDHSGSMPQPAGQA